MANLQGRNTALQNPTSESQVSLEALHSPLTEGARNHSTRPRAKDSDLVTLNKIALQKRLIIVEGISGSGKDTLQAHLRSLLSNRELHDYSEGELLLSWVHLQIKGIFDLQIKLMKLFLTYVRDVISRDENAIFLLNRFHLSAYAFAVHKLPKLAKDYSEVINILRTIPTHVFFLQLQESEIEKRSAHPERSVTWRNFQRQIAQNDGFRGKVERYAWQQQLMLNLAEMQRIPYSVIELAPEIGSENGQWRVTQVPSVTRGVHAMNSVLADFSRSSKRERQTVAQEN